MRINDPKITSTQFLLVIEDIEDSFILSFTTGRPEHITGCESCGTTEDRPGFYSIFDDEWMCGHCQFDPRNDGKLVPYHG